MPDPAELGEDDLAWLRSLPYVYLGGGFKVAYASFCPSLMGMGYVHDRCKYGIMCAVFSGNAHLKREMTA